MEEREKLTQVDSSVAKKRLSRREFLRAGALFLGGLALAACDRKGVVETLTPIEPDPTLVAKRVEELRKELEESTSQENPILNTPETGIYNPEALKRWQELEPQPLIDDRIDIAILPSRYVRGDGTFDWHLDVAKRLGFQAVSAVASPPEFENHTGISIPSGTTLDELIQTQFYTNIFSDPQIKRIHLTCDVNGIGTANGWMFPNGSFSPDQLETTYQEYKRTASYILSKFGSMGKEIIIGGPNEIDLLAKNGYRPETEDANWSEVAVRNAILYFNTFHQAIRDANIEYGGANSLKTGLEILQFRTLWDSEDVVNALSSVVPKLNVPTDEVSLSAWQVSGKGKEGYLLGAALRLIRQYAPQSSIAISEFGVADNDRPALTREQVADEYSFGVSGALANGASRLTVWGLTGFNSDVNFPNNSQERGLGLIRPDGSLRKEVYKALQEFTV